MTERNSQLQSGKR